MNDQNKADLRRLAEAAMNPMYIGDREAQSQERIRARSAFDAMARPSAVLSLLDENAQLRAEVEALRGLLVQCALSAATLRADAPHYANHAGFNEQFTDAIRKAAGVKIGHGVASPKYPSQEDAVAAMAKEGSANG